MQGPQPDPHVLALDESAKGAFLILGGFIARQAQVPLLEAGWRALKVQMGLDEQDELKYAIRDDHPSRRRLDNGGYTHKVRVPIMLDFIARQDIMILADACHETAQTRHDYKVYKYAFDWVIRRYANELTINRGRPAGPHNVVIDTPPADGKDPHAIHDLYLERLHQEQDFILYNRTAPALKDVGFAGGLSQGVGRCQDLLQIADVVVGCIRDYVLHNIGSDGPDLPMYGWPDQNFERIAGLVRSVGGRVRTYGFDVYPAKHPRVRDFFMWTDDLARGRRRAA